MRSWYQVNSSKNFCWSDLIYFCFLLKQEKSLTFLDMYLFWFVCKVNSFCYQINISFFFFSSSCLQVIGNEKGCLEVHRLNERFSNASGDELDSMSVLLQSFVWLWWDCQEIKGLKRLIGHVMTILSPQPQICETCIPNGTIPSYVWKYLRQAEEG